MMGKVFFGVLAVIVFLFTAIAKYEDENPCMEYGPERLKYMQQVGSAMIPIYGKDCIKRGKK